MPSFAYQKMASSSSFLNPQTVLPVAYRYILYLRNPCVYSNSPSILGCFTDSVRFLGFLIAGYYKLINSLMKLTI
jgi:hypothetical protein